MTTDLPDTLPLSDDEQHAIRDAAFEVHCLSGAERDAADVEAITAKHLARIRAKREADLLACPVGERVYVVDEH